MAELVSVGKDMSFSEASFRILEENRMDFSKETLKTYRFILSKFNSAFPGICCGQITQETIHEFRETMIRLGNCDNTISKTLATLKTIINKVRRYGLITINPFVDIRIKKINSTRHYLTMEELQFLYTRFLADRLNLSCPEQDAVLAFLFSCFTGLRYSDLKSLSSDEIKDGKIRKKMHKTGDSVYVPLSSQAADLLLVARPQKNGRILKVTENSYFNRHLRSGARKLGFSKHIHCHLARHTFATTCLTLGIPLDVTSKLLGHRNLATTMIYAKYVDKVLDEQMEKFSAL